MLTRGDDYPIHQAPEPVAFAQGGRNFYDRYFFNGYSPDGSLFFAAALGVYPHLNIMDAAFCVVQDGVQHNVHASRVLHWERADTRVGPISVQVVDPLKQLRVTCDDPKHGIHADLLFSRRSMAHAEPRFTRRRGSAPFMDYTRMTQAGSWQGTLTVQGERHELDDTTHLGSRDRSWGIRPVGAADPQPNPLAPDFSFYWLWAPVNFPDCAAFFHANEDEHGDPWNAAGVVAPPCGVDDEDAEPEMMLGVEQVLDFQPCTRHARSAEVLFRRRRANGGGETRLVFTPQWNFYMQGLGYGNPEWGHGHHKGDLAQGYDEFALADVDQTDFHHQHVQAFCTVAMEGAHGTRSGAGVLEQLIIGPHTPSGFSGLLDFAGDGT